MQYSAGEYLERLWHKYYGRKFTVLCGDQWGDNGKGVVEAALAPYFDAFVREAGGANTGRTRFVTGLDGQQHKLVFHLVPTGWADHKLSVIGDWVLIDLERLNKEIKEIISIIGEPKAQLAISKKAPVLMSYHLLLEQWIEYCRGSFSAKPTGRGISPMLAGMDLRLGIQVGHLFRPDLVRQYVKTAYQAFEPILLNMEKLGMANSRNFKPEDEIERLLRMAEGIRQYVTDTDVILHDLYRKNVSTLFGLTQGACLHSTGTYPNNSATHSIASSAAYCSGLPMRAFGSVIMVPKLLPTRVGAGPFPTHWWDREQAEQFPKDHPELFSELEAYQHLERIRFLYKKQELINSGQATPVEMAQYFMVLGNELGASTGRGREIGGPDLHETAWACKMNGVDSLFITRMDMLSGLRMDLPICLNYIIDGQPVPREVYPKPSEVLDKVQLNTVYFPVDLRNIDLMGMGQYEELPDCVQELVNLYEDNLDVPVSLSLSPSSTEGKIFRL